MTLPLDIDSARDHAPGSRAVQDGPAGGSGEGAPAGPVPHVVGIDLSLASTGVACQHGATLITSSGRKDATLSQRQQRLRHLAAQVTHRVTNCAASDYLILIEGPSYGSHNGSAHDRSGLWWQLVHEFTGMGLRVVEVAPTSRAKYATGKGNAAKDEVLAAAVRRLPIEVNNNNTADAAWLCALGHDLLGAPLVALPESHRSALAAVSARLHERA